MGLDNRAGLPTPRASAKGMAMPVVSTGPAVHAPRKMRIVIATGTPDDPVAKRGSGLTRGPGEERRKALTSVRVTRNGRGLTSGWGMVNGTGMVREAEHHRSAGRFNGSCVTYRGAALGSRDGMTNGSGLTEAGGLADDAGLTNGCGLTHGEGMTNGCGLVRPMDPTVPAPPPRPATRRRGLLGMLGI